MAAKYSSLVDLVVVVRVLVEGGGRRRRDLISFARVSI